MHKANRLVRLAVTLYRTLRFGKAGLIARMSDERMIRVDNLKLLMRQLGIKTKAAMSRQLGVSDTYVHKLLSGQPGTFGEKTARDIEEACKKPRFWLDVVHSDGEYTEESLREASGNASMLLAGEEYPTYMRDAQSPSQAPQLASHATNFPMAPVVEWARLGDDLYRANNEWPTSDRREVPTTRDVSDAIKWIVVSDDSMAPTVLPGDLIAVDPHGSPKRDEVTLMRAATGEFLLRRWRPLPGGGFEAFDEAGRVMEGAKHGLTVVGAFVGVFRDRL